MATSNKEYGSHYSRANSSKKESIGRNTLEYLVRTDTGNYIHQQENIAQRTRHGLFSQPMGLANGDQYHDLKPEPVPKNMVVNKRLVEKVGPEVFEKMGSTNIGDLYKDKFRETQLYQKEKNDLSIHPQPLFAGGKQKLVKHSEFEHMKEFQDKTYNTRDANGNVKTGPKGVLTNNMKKGFGNTTSGHLFGAYQYKGYPFDSQKEMEGNEKLIHKAKIPRPFNGLNHPNATFTPDYQAFKQVGEPYQAKNDDTQYRSKTTHKWNYNNPNKKGLNGTFSEFPKYIEEGEKLRSEPNHQKVWKPNFNGTSKGILETQSKPCPAPSQMLLNSLRRGT